MNSMAMPGRATGLVTSRVGIVDTRLDSAAARPYEGEACN